MKPLHSILIANRGEIALRIMRTCRRMGLRTVAVFSDADADAPHVRFADEAVRLGPAEARASYLDIAAVLRAAKVGNADAVHPGYGFLSENPDFADACVQAGLTFIGPPASAIRAMGLKREAKALAAKHGVPLVPGFDGGDQSTSLLRTKALEIGLPVIFKPSAGGGGKGMKIVRAESELEAAIESSRREALSAFGDATLIIEKYVERARHIEFQVLGDHHGALVHLFERECSIQRRHQKIVEETPSLALTPALRAEMGAAALSLAKAIGYTNAGTVEFMLDASGRFYFSEMNTRLQVEHRVTELVTGLDLVELQLRIARGEPLPFIQADLKQRGHAVQCRLYAEDPARGFMPSVGAVVDWHAAELEHVTVDSGVETGTSVSPHYDPMVAKLIAWGTDRLQATSTLRRALEQLSVQGIVTNRGFLTRLLAHPEYLAGRIHTGFIEAQLGDALAAPVDAARDALDRAAAVIAGHESRRAQRTGPLASLPSGYRNNRWVDQIFELVDHDVRYRVIDASTFEIDGERWLLASRDGAELTLQAPSGLRSVVRVVVDETRTFVHTPRGEVVLTHRPRFPVPEDAALKGGLIAPMPGKVTKVLVTEGQSVTRGQPVVILEAMKMEQTSTAPTDGTIKRVLVREGQQVTAGQALVELA